MISDDRKIFWSVALLLSLCGMGLVLFVTAPWGAAITTDSVCFSQTAISFSMGNGPVHYFKDASSGLMTGWPPFYALLLAAGRFIGLDVYSWARIVNGVLFGINIFLSAGILFYMTRHKYAAWAAAVLLLFQVHFLEVHAAVLSEPFFFLWAFLAMWLLMIYSETGRVGWLAAAAAVSSACLMTRYAGAAVVLTGIVVVLGQRSCRGWRKALHCAGYLAVSLAVPWTWMVFSLPGNAAPGSFVFGFFPQGFDRLGPVLMTLAQYFFPAFLPGWIKGVSLIALIAGLVVWGRMVLRPQGQDASDEERFGAGWRVCCVFLASGLLFFLGLLLTAKGFVPFLSRYLLFIPVLLIMLAAALLSRRQDRALQRMVYAVFAGLGLLMVLRAGQFVAHVYHDGQGYGARHWIKTDLVRTVKTLSEEVPVYTNDPWAFYFYTGRPAFQIPHAGMSAGYWPAKEKVQEDFLVHRAVAVFFEERKFTAHPLWVQLRQDLLLLPAFQDGWGSIYAAPRSARQKPGML